VCLRRESVYALVVPEGLLHRESGLTSADAPSPGPVTSLAGCPVKDPLGDSHLYVLIAVEYREMGAADILIREPLDSFGLRILRLNVAVLVEEERRSVFDGIDLHSELDLGLPGPPLESRLGTGPIHESTDSIR